MNNQDKRLKNLFPAAMHNAVMEIFGEQLIYSYLIGLLSAPVPTAATQDPQIDSYCDDMLHPREITVLSGYRFVKRRSEYLTGRVCAKLAIEGLLNLTETCASPLKLSEIEITSTESGRPNIRFDTPEAGELNMDLSISHSGDYGVALAAESKCGIDLQLQQASLLRVQEKFCSDSEYNLLAKSASHSDPLTRLAVLWASKEAAKKALSYWQMPGFLDLEIWEVENISNYFALSLRVPHAMRRPMPEKVTVVAGMLKNYAMAICLINEDYRDAGITRHGIPVFI